MRHTALFALASLAFLSYTAEASATDFKVRVTNASSVNIALDRPTTCSAGMTCPPISSIPANSYSEYYPVRADPTLYSYWSFDVGAYVNGATYSCYFTVTVSPGASGSCPKLNAYGWATSGTAGSPTCAAPVKVQQPSGSTCSDGQVEVAFAP
jgi:hypothetical protein